jgi:hypothetical protein
LARLGRGRPHENSAAGDGIAANIPLASSAAAFALRVVDLMLLRFLVAVVLASASLLQPPL